MNTLLHDLRFALRQLRRQPGLAAVVVITLALAIGATTALFSVAEAVLLRPLGVPDSDRVVQVWDEYPEGWAAAAGGGAMSVAFPTYHDYRDQARGVFEHLAAFQGGRAYRTDTDRPEDVLTLAVSPEFFPLLDLAPALGRTFAPEEQATRDAPVALLTHEYWQAEFGGDPDVLGRTLSVSRWWDGTYGFRTVDFRIVGVLRPGFAMPPVRRANQLRVYTPDVLLPLSWSWGFLDDNRGMYAVTLLGRLEPGVSVEQARSRMAAVALGVAERHPDTNAGYRAELAALPAILRQAYGTPLLLLAGTVAFVLLIACANVANVLLARAVGRRREFAVRAALGAGRGRVLRQLVTEGLVLGLMGAAGALVIARIALPLVLAKVPGDVARLEGAAINARVFLFTLAVAIGTTLLFGLAPAWRAARVRGEAALREASGRVAGAQRRLLGSLVVGEVALALVLLAGAGLLLNSFVRMTRIQPGFEVEHVLSVPVTLPIPALSKYKQQEQIGPFFDQVIDRVRALPGVIAASGIERTPFSGRTGGNEITVPGRDRPAADEKLTTDLRYVVPDYFRTMSIPLLRGRFLDSSDEQPSSHGSVVSTVINRTMAERYWPGQDPVGKSYFWGIQDLENEVYDPRYPLREFRVVGVVGDVKTSPGAEPTPQAYIPFMSMGYRNALTLVIRTSGDPEALPAAIRAAILDIDPNEPQIGEIRTAREELHALVAEPRFYLVIAAAFAGLALLLAVVGLYGVMSYSVSERTREIGVRMALGADAGTILRLVLGQAGGLVLAGLALGLLLALAGSRLLQGLLYEVAPGDPLTLGAVAALLLAVALAAGWIPARRAARVDPMIAIRNE